DHGRQCGRQRHRGPRAERRIRRSRLADRRRDPLGPGAACAHDAARRARRDRQADCAAGARAALSGGRARVSTLAMPAGHAGSFTRSWVPRDRTLLLVAPAVLFLLAFFIYPFAYGFVLSFLPNE